MNATLVQIQELLKGYTVDKKNIQSVGNMTVIPIVSDNEFTNVADQNEVVFSKDPTYNQLEFKNQSGNIGIAMQGWTMIDNKQRAQDRTIPYAHLIKAANSKLIPANCVQAHQPGSFDTKKVDQSAFMILPPSLRGVAIKKNTYDHGDTGNLWDTLSTWVRSMNCREEGLTNFYSKFEDKLNEFIAQFEPVDKQLGAIVLINDNVVAIDIVPKYETWKSCWRAIIRDSYGAEALRVIENEGAVISHTALDQTKVKTLDDLEAQFLEMKSSFYDSVQNVVGGVLQLSLGHRQLEQINELTMLKLENEQFVGQGVVHGEDHFVYLSLVSANATPAERKKFQSLRTQPYSQSSFQFRN